MKMKAWFYVAGQFVLFAALAASLLIFPAGQMPILRIVGLALIVVGFIIIAAAVRQHMYHNAALPNITPTPNVRAELIMTGIYKRVRHPIYSGVLAGALGVALAHGHLAVLFVALVLMVFFTYKSRYEESLLSAVYPDYVAYRRRSGRFVPFI